MQLKYYTYCQVIQRAVWMILQVEVFKFQLKWAAMTGFQPPLTFGAVVVGHRVVRRREYACGGGQIAPTTYRRKKQSDRRKKWKDAYPFLSHKIDIFFSIELALFFKSICKAKSTSQRSSL